MSLSLDNIPKVSFFFLSLEPTSRNMPNSKTKPFFFLRQFSIKDGKDQGNRRKAIGNPDLEAKVKNENPAGQVQKKSGKSKRPWKSKSGTMLPEKRVEP
jgi:hypothetical protein